MSAECRVQNVPRGTAMVHLWLFPVLITTPFTEEAHVSGESGSGETEAEAWAQVEGDFRERHPEKGWRIARDEGKPTKQLFNLSADNPLLIERERLRLRAMAAGVSAQEAA